MDINISQKWIVFTYEILSEVSFIRRTRRTQYTHQPTDFSEQIIGWFIFTVAAAAAQQLVSILYDIYRRSQIESIERIFYASLPFDFKLEAIYGDNSLEFGPKSSVDRQ